MSIYTIAIDLSGININAMTVVMVYRYIEYLKLIYTMAIPVRKDAKTRKDRVFVLNICPNIKKTIFIAAKIAVLVSARVLFISIS